jgi:universal stress protein A
LQLEQQAKERLASICEPLNVADENQLVILGQPATEMRRLARDRDIDLIVVGSHGRHGLALIFGSTSNSVLHGAPCDVLAVRIADE